MALHPKSCFCDSCRDPVFCDPAYPDFERVYRSTPLPKQWTGTKVNPEAFGSYSDCCHGPMNGFVMQSVRQFPSPDDPAVLDLSLEQVSPLTQSMVKHHLAPLIAPKNMFQLIQEAKDQSDGIAPTKPANPTQKAPSGVAKKSNTGKYLFYGLIAYLVLRR